MLKAFALSTVLALSATSAMAAPQRYTLDSQHTTVAFLVEHLGFARTLGQFSDVSGGFTYDDETRQVSDVTITVKTDSVQTHNEARDKHLRSKDFLNTKKFPEMIFTSDGAVVQADGSAELPGNLQLLAETRPLVLSVSLNKEGKYPFGHKLFTLGVSARGALQRSDYGMDYGVANAMVGDDVEMIIEIEGNQEK
jgi:polyisoprenoid-binding protein YceI